MITKEALDKFALDIAPTMGDTASFLMKHYKPILGTLAGAYLLSKILPAAYNYSHMEKDEKAQEMQNYLLQNIARQTQVLNPMTPKKDTYQYVF